MPKYLLGIIILLLSSCSQTKVCEDILSIHIPDESVSCDSFFHTFKYEKAIQLQTSDDYIVSEIRRLIIEDSLVFILNGYRQVFVFNQDGSFIRHIGEVGRGTGEYGKLLDIATDRNNRRLFLYSDDHRIIEYSYDGVFLKQNRIKKGSLYKSIKYENGDLYFFKELGTSDGSLISILDGKSIKNASTLKTCDFPVSFSGVPFVKGKSLLFSQTSSNIIYEFNGKNSKKKFQLIIPHFITEEGRDKYNQNKNVMDILTDIYRKSITYDITSIRETNDGIFLKTNQSPLIWIKPNYQESTKFGTIIDKTISNQPLNYLAHDGNDDSIIFLAEGSAVAEREGKNKIPELESKLATMNEHSNPILLFFKHNGFQ